MKPGDLVRIRTPEYAEECWDQIGIIIEMDNCPRAPNPLKVMTPVDIYWFEPSEVDLVNDDDPDYDILKENE